MSEKKSNPIMRAGGGAVGLLLLAVILFAANLIIRNLKLRVDLTNEKLYTLSDGSRAYLAKLQHPITLKFFFSRGSAEVPVRLKAYAQQVEDFLVEYRSAANGNIIIERYDPKVDSDEEDLARRHGIVPQNRNPFAPPIYFGLAAQFGDTTGVIPALDPSTENMLEYNITRLIHRVMNPAKPVIGVLSSLPVLGSKAPMFPGMPPQQSAAPWLAFQELGRDYELRDISADVKQIDSDVQALIVVHPKNLPLPTLYAIDQFVLRGGQMLAFVDPFCLAELESAQPSPFGMPDASSNMEILFKAWGIGFDAGQILADINSSTRLGGGNGQVDENPVFLTLRAQQNQIERDDLLTAQLDTIMIPFGGVLTDLTATNAMTFTPLIYSSDMAGPVAAMTVQMGSQAIRRIFKPVGVKQVIAARISGNFPTAFPEGAPAVEPPPAAEEDPENPEAPKPEVTPLPPQIQEGRSGIIVVADTDLIYNRFAAEEMNLFGSISFRPMNDNISLLANAVEQLSGGVDLISIRSRGSFARPFERVIAIETKARDHWQKNESTLIEQLEQTRQRLALLQQQKDDNQRFIMSPEQEKELQSYRAEELRINQELRGVQKQLRADIDRLGFKVKLINIALVPGLVVLTGLGFGWYRRQRG